MSVRSTVLGSERLLPVPKRATGPDGRRSTMANGTVRSKHDGRGTGRTKIDWAAARRYFIRNPECSLADIGRMFGVSDVAVGKHAKAERWDERRNELLAELAAKEEANDLPSLEQRQADTIRVAQKLRRRVLDLPANEVDPTAAIRTIPRYATLEQLYEGEATERIAVGEVEALFGAAMIAFRSVVEEALVAAGVNGKRRDVLSYVDGKLPERMAELTAGDL
jgi:hypothetical protein